MIEIIIYVVIGLNLILLTVMVLLRIGYPVQYRVKPITTFPHISILLAVRNERYNILECLQSLDKLNYPSDKLEILIGNDESTDDSVDIIRLFIADKPCFQLVNVADFESNTRAKARVLSLLASKASGDVFFVTDADMQLPPQWIQQMLAGFGEKTGIVTGFSVTEGGSFAAKMQAVDWVYSLSLIQLAADLAVPVTTMGNNMAITRDAYEAVGGYEAIPFSVTEDFALFKAVHKKGFKTKNIAHHSILGITKPVEKLATLLNQRKRWMVGALLLPKWLVVLLLIQGVYFPSMLVLAFMNYKVAIVLGLLKILLELKFITFTLVEIRKMKFILMIPLWEIYNAILSQMVMIYSIIPIQIKWKGRRF